MTTALAIDRYPLPVISASFLSTCCAKDNHFLENNNLLADEQEGFRRNTVRSSYRLHLNLAFLSEEPCHYKFADDSAIMIRSN